MSSQRPVPVTVIAGADAMGLARRLRGPGDCIVGPSWDGQGSILLEPDVAHRTPGCPCCAMRLDVVDGLLRAVRRARRPRRILLLAGLHDDVTTITYTVLSDADLTRHVRLDGVVMTVDAVSAATRISSPGPLGTSTELDALAVADVIVVGRSRELTSDGFGRLVAALRSINLVGSVRAPAPAVARDDAPVGASWPDHPSVDMLTGLDAWHGAPAVDPRVSSSAPSFPAPSFPGGSDGPATVVLRQTAPLDPDAVDEWLAQLVDRHARRLLRMQGALSVVSVPERVCCHGVRSFAMSHSENADPARSRRNESLVLVIGHGLDVAELADGFAATRSR
jgi:G3E family GTPase